MQQFLSNGGLSKMLWIITTFLLAIGAIIIFFVQIFNGQSPNPLVVSILSGILSHAFTVGGNVLNTQHEPPTINVTAPLPAPGGATP